MCSLVTGALLLTLACLTRVGVSGASEPTGSVHQQKRRFNTSAFWGTAGNESTPERRIGAVSSMARILSSHGRMASGGFGMQDPPQFDPTAKHSALPVFIHIPKTAGRHLMELFTEEYGHPIPPMWTHTAARRYRRGALNMSFDRYFYVHFDDQGVDELLQLANEITSARNLPSPRVVTVLRDPVQRIVSEYYSYHDLSHHNPALTPQACSPGSLELYLKDPCSWDRQVRFLDGSGNQAGSGIPGADKAMVQRVVEFLNNTNAIVLSADCFDYSVHRLGSELNWRTLANYDPEQARSKTVFSAASKHNISHTEWTHGGPWIRELARNATKFDQMLYDTLAPQCPATGDSGALTHWLRKL